MKIGPYTLQSPFHRETVTALDAASGKGLYASQKVNRYDTKMVKDYFDAYTNDDLIRAPVDDLIESALGLGYYNTVEKVSKKFKKSPTRDLCDEFGEQFNLDQLLPNVGRLAVIAGFCPVETRLVDELSKCALKIVHPVTVTDVIQDPITGEVVSIHQKVNSQERDISGKNLAWFTYCKVGNDPRGLSLVRGILGTVNTLRKADSDITNILERYTAPIGIWRSTGKTEALRAAVVGRNPGEDIFLGNQTPEELNQKPVEFVAIDPRVPFWEYVQDKKNQIFAYMRASNLWYEKDATLASDTALEQIIGRHIRSVQREFKRSIERCWYKPLVEMRFGEEAEVPRINWGKEPTGVEDITPSEIITKGLDLAYLSQSQYYEILKQIGVKVTEPEVEDEKTVEEKDEDLEKELEKEEENEEEKENDEEDKKK